MTSSAAPFLHSLIDVYFDDDDFRELCFEIGGPYSYDSLRGRGKRDKVNALVSAAIRRDDLPRLREILKEKRPAVDWESTRVPTLPQVARPKNRPALLLAAFIVLGGIIAALTWLYFRPSREFAVYTLLPEEALGIAVAQLGVSGDCRRGSAGREASVFLYELLESQIASVGLDKKVALTTVGLVCNQERAIEEGERVRADIVIWGWVPQSAEGILGQYTFVEPPAGVGAATLAHSLELLIGGPAQSRYYRLTGRAEALVRFVLGLIYAKDKDYRSSLAMFERAIQIIETQSVGLPNTDSLAVLYTERGITLAAMKEPDRAFASYQHAETLNPDYIGLQIALGSYYYNRREWDSARNYFDRANAHGDELPSIAYGYGLLDYYAQKYEAAIGHFKLAEERALARDEEPVLPWLGLGYAYQQLGRCYEAAAAFGAIAHSETAENEVRQTAERELTACPAATPVPSITALSTALPAITLTSMATTTLLPTLTLTSTPTSVAMAQVLCARHPTVVRQGPALDAPHFAVLSQGDPLVWVAEVIVGEWYFVQTSDGRVGWLSMPDATLCAVLPPGEVETFMPILTTYPQTLSVPSATPAGYPTPIIPTAATTVQIPQPALATATLLPTALPPPTATLLPTPTLLPTATQLPPPTEPYPGPSSP